MSLVNVRPLLLHGLCAAILLGSIGCGGSEKPAAYAEPEATTAPSMDQEIRVVQNRSGGVSSAMTNAQFSEVALTGLLVHAQSAETYRSKVRPYSPRHRHREYTAQRTVVAANAPKEKSDTASDAHDVALLVYTAGLNLAVFQVVEKMNTVEALARNSGGYLSKRADQEITIRVPREKFFEVLTAIEKLGDVLHRDVQATDVTDEYVDTEARLKNAHALRDRFEALLTHASVKDAVEISKELAKVTEIIEQLEGKMKLLKNKISFATIVVSFAARDNATVPDRSLLPFPWLQQMGLTPLLSVDR